MICDRSVLDNYVYLLLAAGRAGRARRAGRSAGSASYDLLVHVPVVEPRRRPDGIRSADPAFQRAVDERLEPRARRARRSTPLRLDPDRAPSWLDDVEREVSDRVLEPAAARRCCEPRSPAFRTRRRRLRHWTNLVTVAVPPAASGRSSPTSPTSSSRGSRPCASARPPRRRRLVVRTGRRARVEVYLLASAACAIQRKTPYGLFALARLGPGDLFGETAFVDRGPRSGDAVTVTAATDLVRLRPDAARRGLIERDQRLAPAPSTGVLEEPVRASSAQTNEKLTRFFSGVRRRRRRPRGRSRHVQAGGDFRVDIATKRKLFDEQKLSSLEINFLSSLSRETSLRRRAGDLPRGRERPRDVRRARGPGDDQQVSSPAPARRPSPSSSAATTSARWR